VNASNKKRILNKPFQNILVTSALMNLSENKNKKVKVAGPKNLSKFSHNKSVK